MTLGMPLAASTVAGAALTGAAVLGLLYLIKLRRRQILVPYARLWQDVLAHYDATSKWRRLRRLWSFLLALLVLGLMAFAATNPLLGGTPPSARSVVLLVDVSASMQARDGGNSPQQTRLAAAQAHARRLASALGGADQAMLMAAGSYTTPMTRFSSDHARLTQAIDELTATDAPLDATRAFTAAADALQGRPNPMIIFLGDGANLEADLATLQLPTGIAVHYLGVGHGGDNAAIIGLAARRYILQPAAYELVAEVANTGPKPTTRTLTLYNDDTALEAREVTLAPGERTSIVYRGLPATDARVLRATLGPSTDGTMDLLATDDTAYALLPPRRTAKVLLVTNDNLYLEGAILANDEFEEAKVTPAEYDQDPSVANGYTAVIFDEHTPAVLPPAPIGVILFHPQGPNNPFALTHTIARPRLSEVHTQHPVMRWLSLSDVNFDQGDVFEVRRDRGEVALASAARDAIVVARQQGKQRLIGLGFTLPAPGRAAATDLPLRVAFPLLLANAIDWMLGSDATYVASYATGRSQTVFIDGATAARRAALQAPNGSDAQLPILDQQARFYPTQLGIYRLTLEGRESEPRLLAVNLSNLAESSVAPAARLAIGATPLTPPPTFSTSVRRALWWYLIWGVLALLLLEWYFYHRRITV